MAPLLDTRVPVGDGTLSLRFFLVDTPRDTVYDAFDRIARGEWPLAD